MQSRPDRACGSDSDLSTWPDPDMATSSVADLAPPSLPDVATRSFSDLTIPVAFRSGTTISFRPGLKLAKVQPDLNPIKTIGNMQSRPDRPCRSDSDPVYMIRSRYGNLICFRSGAPIYTGCNNQIIFRSDNSIVFRSGTTISFRPGLKLAKVQPDLNPIKTIGSI